MNAMPFKAAINAVGRFIVKNAPTILLGLGIAGTGVAIVLTDKASPKAKEHIKQEEKKKGDVLTPVETVKAVWKDYAPAVGVELASIACIVAGGSVQHRRNASLVAAYTLLNKAASEYVEKTAETVGEEKAKEIGKKLAKRKVEKAEPELAKLETVPSDKIRFIESITGQPFASDKETINAVINKLNYRLNLDDVVSLNDLLNEFDLRESNIGDEFGWRRDKGLIDISYDYAPDTKGRPCAVIKYSQRPDYLWN